MRPTKYSFHKLEVGAKSLEMTPSDLRPHVHLKRVTEAARIHARKTGKKFRCEAPHQYLVTVERLPVVPTSEERRCPVHRETGH